MLQHERRLLRVTSMLTHVCAVSQVETCDPPCRTFDLEFVPFVSVRVDNVVGNGTASFPLQLNANPLPQQSVRCRPHLVSIAALCAGLRAGL